MFRIADVAEKIVELTDSSSKVTFGESYSFLREGAFPNITKAKETIGWFPLVTIEDGLRKTIEYTQAHKDLLVFREDF